MFSFATFLSLTLRIVLGGYHRRKKEKTKMVTSPFKDRTSYRFRSISFPSNSHPLNIKIEEQLQRLRSSQATISSSSSSSICQNLGCLKDLYDCMEDFLQLPVAYQGITCEPDGKWVDNVLDGSLRLLDSCGTTRDVLLKIKEKLHDLQSSFRRGSRGNELDLANKISSYLATRKKLKKVIQRCMGDLKSMERNCFCSFQLDKGDEVVAILIMLKQVEAITLSVFRSLLAFISWPKTQYKYYHLSVISKLMQLASKQEGVDFNEVGKVDAALQSLSIPKLCKGTRGGHVKDVQDRLEALEIIIQCFEDGLDCLFRGMIKSRVSLLNILNQ